MTEVVVTPDQLALFGDPRARKTDPETSQEAAASVKTIAAEQRRRLLATLVAYGPATADEIDERVGWRATTAGRRMKELEGAGCVEPVKVKGIYETRLTRSKRPARVYRHVPGAFVLDGTAAGQ